MSNSQGHQDQGELDPADWSDQELQEATMRVHQKYVGKWSKQDRKIVWEDIGRKTQKKHSQVQTLQDNDEFVVKDWVRFITETVVDIYLVEKRLEWNLFSILRLIEDIRNDLGSANENILNLPRPTPCLYNPSDPFHLLESADWRRLRRIEDMLEDISRRLGL